MNTITFGNAFSIRYKYGASAQDETHQSAAAGKSQKEIAQKREEVGDRFARLAQEITGQEARRVTGPQGEFLLMDGPQRKTLSLYKELERGLGKGATPEEQAENTRIILETMQKKGVLPASPKSVTLQYGRGQVVDKGLVTRKFKEMGFPIVAEKAAEASAPTAAPKSGAPKSYAKALKSDIESTSRPNVIATEFNFTKKR